MIAEYTLTTALNKEILLLSNVEERLTSKNTPYLYLTLSDHSGSIHANLWDTNLLQFPYHSGDLLFVNGTLKKYGENLEIKTTPKQLQLYKNIQECDWQEQELFIQRAPIDPKLIAETIQQTIQSLSSPYKEIMVQLFNYISFEQFLAHPYSVQKHHDYMGGLAYHTYKLLKMSEPIITIYHLDKDLMHSLIILHGLGRYYGIKNTLQKEYSKIGEYLDDTLIIDSLLVKIAGALNLSENENELLQLRHGIQTMYTINKDSNTIIRPKTLEANTLAYLISLDVTNTIFIEQESQTKV